MPADNWLIYAMGGGWGHLTRALSLAKVAAESRRVKIICNSKYLKSLWQNSSWNEIVGTRKIEIIDCCHLRSAVEKVELKDLIEHHLNDRSLSTFIVDSFPRGLIGELEDLLVRKSGAYKTVLIHRDLNPDYVDKYNLRDFAIANFDLIINPGEGSRPAFYDVAESTVPWLIRSSEELQKSTHLLPDYFIEARNRVLICPSGKDAELESYVGIAQKLATDFSNYNFFFLGSAETLFERDNLRQLKYWPAIDLIALSSVVIGSGGYNISYECSALKVPLLALAQSRMYDRQKLRLLDLKHHYFDTETQVLEGFAEFIAQTQANQSIPLFENGVASAVQKIEELQAV